VPNFDVAISALVKLSSKEPVDSTLVEVIDNIENEREREFVVSGDTLGMDVLSNVVLLSGVDIVDAVPISVRVVPKTSLDCLTELEIASEKRIAAEVVMIREYELVAKLEADDWETELDSSFDCWLVVILGLVSIEGRVWKSDVIVSIVVSWLSDISCVIVVTGVLVISRIVAAVVSNLAVDTVLWGDKIVASSAILLVEITEALSVLGSIPVVLVAAVLIVDSPIYVDDSLT
jgi:hypothetical protein